MSRYGKYFLQHLLCLEDTFCHYYVQDDSWGRQEILDVASVIFDWDEDAQVWLVQCAEHDSYTTLSRLRALLAEDCLTQHQVHRMSDRQVVRTAARELTMNAYQMVIEPKIGWAVRVDPVTEEPVQPIAVEAAPDMDDMLGELRVELDGLVDEQKKNYQQWEAKLADMSDAEKAALYGKKAGGGLYNATIGSLVDLAKATPGLAKKAASAWWKFKTYPLRLARITAQAIKTGSMDPLQKEIKAKLGPVVRGSKQLKHFTSMTMVLLGEEATRDMLLNFVDRYWDNTHPLEKTELGAEAASEVVINILLVIFTAGVGVAANVVAKSGRLVKVAKMLERVAGFLKRMKSLGRLPKKRTGVGKKGPKAQAKASAKGKGPKQPATPAKKAGVDDGKIKGYSDKGDIEGPKTTTKTTPEAKPKTKPAVKPKTEPNKNPKEIKDNKNVGLSGTAKKAKWAKARQGVEGPGVRDHFQKHGEQVGAKTAKEYDLSSRKTIQNGRKFTYRDRMSGDTRVGYHDPNTGLFTATSQTRKTPAILSHFPETWENLRKLPGFSVK